MTIHKKKETLLKQIEIYRKKIKKTKKIITSVDQAKGDYEAKVGEKIDQSINLVYKKINRHTNIEKLSIKRNNTKAKNVEVSIGSDVNFSNIMSTGQITSVALSFFIGLGLVENSTYFSTYFMDDPIQNLDDVNILAFVDLIKTQLKSENGFAQQIIFATCDEDFEKLLKYKVRHHDIGVKNLKFTNYGEYIM